QDVGGGAIASAVGLPEKLPSALIERFVDAKQAGRRDLLADGAGDTFGGVEERIVLLAPVRPEPAVEALANPMNRTKQDAALAENVRLVLKFQRRLEGTGRAEPDRRGQVKIGRPPVDILMDGEAAIDPGTIYVAALLVEPPHRGSHALGAYPDDVDVVAKGLAGAVHIRHEESVRQPERGAG